jgi:hypothetical protein
LPAKTSRPSAAQGRWRARPLLSLLVRFGVFAAPLMAGMAGALVVSWLLPRPSGFVPGIAWWLAVITGALAPVIGVERLARRWLPLAVLLQLSLVFPDRTPSRMRIAQQAARTRDLTERLHQARKLGSLDEPNRAAETVLALIVSLGSHDRKTRGHSERVRVVADLLAETAGVSKSERDRFRWSALLHDIGKISVPARILNKPGRPDDREWSILRRHPAEGARMAGPLLAWLGPWAGAIEHHHERFDGTGYPSGLAGNQISLGGRILAIADAYEVMTAARSYKKPMTARAAREELARNSGTHFDPDLVRAFLAISLGRLVWAVGLVALLAQLPVFGRLWLSGLADRFGRAVAHTAAATTLVAAFALPGAMPLRSSANDGSRIEAVSQDVVPRGFPARGLRSDRKERPDGSPHSRAKASVAPADSGSRPVPANDPPDSPTRGEEPDEDRPPREEAPPPVTFSATGRIKAGNPLSPSRGGITVNEFLLSCGIPASQGIDAWVFRVPSGFPEGGARVSARGDASGFYDLDIRFFSGSCDFLGAVRTERSDEVGVVPEGARFIVVSETRGLDTGLRLTVTSR